MTAKTLSPIVFFSLLSVFSSCSNVHIETNDSYRITELPDGSTAYLNHNSSLTYDEDFDPRVIEIKGEIFLSVTKRDSPFIVQTGLGEIKVLGTEFNVKTGKNEMSVEVKKGRVELKTTKTKVKVDRGELAVYKKDEREIIKREAEFDFDVWLNSLKIECRKLGKEIKQGSGRVGEESKKIGRELGKEMKKLKIKYEWKS